MSRILYLSWPAHEITGGIKMVFRHVEALRQAGFDAHVATADAKPPPWFETTAPVLSLAQAARDEDVLVFPENHAGLLKAFQTWRNRKVVFCQNPFMIYRGLEKFSDYRDFGVRAILCPGQQTAAFCRRRCPSQELFIVPYPVDRSLFKPALGKRLQVAFAPRKRPQEAAFIQDLCSVQEPLLRSAPWVAIANRSEQEVAHLLGESALYLSLCRFEAVPLSTLEALACGCLVAGFTGFGARDYATARNGFWAAEDDCVHAAEQLLQAVQMFREGGDRYRDMLDAASLTVDYYRDNRFRARLLETWRVILSQPST